MVYKSAQLPDQAALSPSLVVDLAQTVAARGLGHVLYETSNIVTIMAQHYTAQYISNKINIKTHNTVYTCQWENVVMKKLSKAARPGFTETPRPFRCRKAAGPHRTQHSPKCPKTLI